MTTDTPRTDEAAVDVWRKSNGERMATSSDKVDADFARCLERELNEAREQWRMSSVCRELNDANERMGKKLAQTLDERDRLVEALQKLRNNESMSLGGAAYEIVEQTLQSLTQNAKL
jgi:predicted RNase H-like nuclease (RuvC/YqgF family)